MSKIVAWWGWSDSIMYGYNPPEIIKLIEKRKQRAFQRQQKINKLLNV